MNRPPQSTPECEHENKYASRCDDECACDLLHIMCKDCGEYIDTIETDFETYPKQQPHEVEHDRKWCANCVFRGKNVCTGTIETPGGKISCPCNCHAPHEGAGESQDWRERFDEAIQSWRQGGGPYWPDWEAVEKFIAKEIEAAEKETVRKCQKILDDVVGQWWKGQTGTESSGMITTAKYQMEMLLTTPPTNHKDTPV